MSPRDLGPALGVAAASVPLLLLMLAPGLRTDGGILEFDSVDVMYRDVADRVSRGQVPYRDFLFEYPIGCLPQILLPRLAGGDATAYRTGYVAEMLAVNALLILAIAREVIRREGREALPRRLAWYLLCYFFLCRLIVSRLDIVPTLLAFVSASEWSGGRPVLGGALAAVGGLVKLFPALAALPGVLGEVSERSGGRPRGLLTFALVFAAGLAGWGMLGGIGTLDAILYHTGRGLEIESVPAGLLMLAGRLVGARMAVEIGHGCIELDSPWSGAAVVAARCVMAMALGATLIAFARSTRRADVRCVGALFLAAIATAPVLSPQFLIWPLPFVIAAEGGVGRRARPLFAAACVLTFLIYPILFVPALMPMRMPAILVLNLRNALVIATWAILAFGQGGETVDVDDRRRGS